MTTTLDELLATIAQDAGTAPRPATAPPIPPKVDELDLDDGPVLTTDRLWPSAIPEPRRKGPPPPPPGRRARGTAPLGEVVNSGLIDVRAIAAGTEPIDRVEPEVAPVDEQRWRPSPALVRGAVVAVIGGALAAAALLAGSLMDRGQREETERPLETFTASEPFLAPPLVITAQPELGLDAPLEVRVIPLPTQVTEVAEPSPPTELARAAEPAMAVARPPVRTARTRVPVEVSAVAGVLPMRPSNSEIASAVVAAQQRLSTCGDLYGTTGPVPVKLRVAPSGVIASVSVNQGNTTFRSCVASALRRQRLPASQVGTTASFPVLIR
ncbi:MAG TPA: hypothetical protein VIG06_26910 [Kofleriaceae bacterium]